MKLSISKRIGLILAVTMFVCLGLMLFILLLNEENNKSKITEESVNELTKVIKESLIFSMNEGVSDVSPFIERSSKIKNLSQLRVTPTNIISDGSEKKLDAVEREILRSKKRYESQEDFEGQPVLRFVEPILAEENCLSCHEAKIGDPLAIISVRYSMLDTLAANTSQRFWGTFMAVAAIALNFFMVMYFIKKDVIKDLHHSVTRIKKLSTGDISSNEQINRNDEIGELIDSLDTLRNSLDEQAIAANEIACGNLNTEIKVLSEKDTLGRAMLDMKKNLQKLLNDLTGIVMEATKGNLSARANTEGYQGDYKSIITGLNNTLDSITHPIKDGAKVLAYMAEGDFSYRVTKEYSGDLKMITDSINTVAESMKIALMQVGELVNSLASATSQITSSTEEMAAGSQENSSQATEIASAVEQMTSTILQTTRNASSAAEFSKKAGVMAQNGSQVVKQTVDGMNKIAAVVGNAAMTVKELGNSSNQIGEIIQVIDDIADQTNLLALNAAIEAARAGEQGRGFAVVADEVRKLAERTTKATKEIAAMIKQIQRDTGNAVESIESGTKEVEHGKEFANKANIALEEIIESTNQTIDVINQVAAASEEQSSAAEQISKSVEGISNVTQESASGIQQIAHAAEDMNSLTDKLQIFIRKFKLDNNQKQTGSLSIRSNGKITSY